MSRLKRALPWIWTCLLGIAGALAVILQHEPGQTASEIVIGVVSVLLVVVLLTALGAFIGTRQPDNPISWVFYAMGAGMFFTVAPSPLIESGQPADPTYLHLLALYASHAWVAIFYPLFLLLFIFPSGHFLNRRWRWGGWLGWVIGLASVTAVFTDPISAPFAEPPWALENPIGFLPPPLSDWASAIGTAAFPMAALGGFAAIVVRYRVSTDIVRTQIRWVVYAASLTVLTFSLIQVGFQSESGSVNGALFFSTVTLIPIAVTIAITRYKLYEIDRIISRSISYVLVIGLLAATYFGLVAAIAALLPVQSGLAVAASTLAVAALFNPLRRRVHQLVDKRFNRSRYQARLVEDRFAARLRGSLSAEELATVWAETVDQHLQPAASGIWLREDSA